MGNNYLIKLALIMLFSLCTGRGFAENNIAKIRITDRPDTKQRNTNYTGNRFPLLPMNFIKLPVGNVKPSGWLNKYILLQKEGLTGHLGEISAWLEKDNNAWLGHGGNSGWEEVPYWLKGYGEMAYILNDESMITETKKWIEGVFKTQTKDGYFGPVSLRNGKRDLWPNMIMLWCLQSYYEYSKDVRVINLMDNYFKWELSLSDDQFLEDYWENSRGGDNLISVYWLYNITGEKYLLDLARKIHKNTANWEEKSILPNWHNVNIAQCFREPATYYMLSKDSFDLQATYNVHNLVRRIFGQVPGGMFGADENARMGSIDPRQGTETCGFVEQMASDEQLLLMTGDPFWAEHCEDIAFNSYPAAVMPNFKALRYITAPNQVISDSEDHSPGIQNNGPFLSMNPFSSRCCQHNHSQGWPYYIEHLIVATSDNGLAVPIYGPCTAIAKVAGGTQVSISENTHYPFEESVNFAISLSKPVNFPLYLRIPSWTKGASVLINGQQVSSELIPGKYVCIERKWNNGDKVTLNVPMHLSERVWTINKNSRSINYGPLSFSLKIREKYVKVNSIKNAISDSKWQKGADPNEWPTYEIYPESSWNYALVINDEIPLSDNFKVIKKQWPSDDFPYEAGSTPIEIKAKGKRIPSWTVDKFGLCSELPEEDCRKSNVVEDISLIPMGAARLRISAFPVSK